MRLPRYFALPAAVLAGLAQVHGAQAAGTEIRVKIAAQPVRSALIELALQSNLSLGGALEACHGQSPSLSGRMPLATALDRLLADSGCSYRLPDPRTIVIQAQAPTRAAARLPKPLPLPPTSEGPPSETSVGEIVITAQRYPSLPGRTPYAISAISGDMLDQQNIEALQDLSGQVAGMTVTNLGAGRDKILLRGLSDGVFTGKAQAIVALYLDDVPITYSAPDPELRLADVQRVEVMRGPQGTLYGGGSIGGVVRIATHRPNLDLFSGEATIGSGVTAGGAVNSEAEAIVNVPLAPGRIGLRAVGYREREGGYIDNPALGLKRVNASTRDGFRISLAGNLSPIWTITAAMTSQAIHIDDTQYGLRSLGPRRRDNLVREPHENDFDHLSLSLNGKARWGDLSASAATISHQFSSRFDASTAVSRFGGPPRPTAYDEGRNIDLTIAEVTYATPAMGRFRGLMGVFFSNGRTTFDDALTSVSNPAAGALYAERRRDDINETAFYGEASYQLTSKLTATLGLRAFDFGFTTSSTVQQAGSQRLFNDTGRETGLSPKFLLSYAASPNQLFYLQAAEGYRPGGFNTGGQIGQAFDVAGAPVRRYDADELWNYEAGAKLRWLDDRIQLRLAVFYATWEQIQSDQYLTDGLPFTANIGAGDNTGVELEGAWRITDRFDLRAAALINEPQITRANPGFAALADAGLPGVSSASAGVTLDYHRALSGGRTLHALAQANYVGGSHLTFDAKATRAMGDYVSLRGGLSLETARWTLSASIDNPFNKTPNTFSFGNPFIIAQDQVITPVQPRTVAVRLTRRF